MLTKCSHSLEYPEDSSGKLSENTLGYSLLETLKNFNRLYYLVVGTAQKLQALLFTSVTTKLKLLHSDFKKGKFVLI